LLQRRPNHSACVPELTPGAVEDIFFARMPLELHTVRALVERGSALPYAQAAVTRLEAMPADAHWSAVVDADLEFHRALIDALDSSRLSRLHASLEGEIRLCIAQLRPAWHTPAALAQEHREVLDGILAGDAVAAVARMREHLEKAVRDLTGRARELTSSAD
jgi:DNA-binding GntR family transcriptional regulator